MQVRVLWNLLIFEQERKVIIEDNFQGKSTKHRWKVPPSNPSTREAEVGEMSQVKRPARAPWRALGWSGLHSKMLPQRQPSPNKIKQPPPNPQAHETYLGIDVDSRVFISFASAEPGGQTLCLPTCRAFLLHASSPYLHAHQVFWFLV